MAAFNFEKAIEQKKNLQHAREYLWRVELPNPIDFPEPPFDSQSFEYAKEIVRYGMSSRYTDEIIEELGTRVTSIETPFFTVDSDKTTRGSTFWYRAMHNDIDTVTITMEEVYQQDRPTTRQYLNDLKSLIVNSNGTYNPPFFYKQDFVFYALNTQKLDVEGIRFKGYFISEVSSRENNYDTNDIKVYTARFTGDSSEDIFIDEGKVKDTLGKIDDDLISRQLENNFLQLDELDAQRQAAIFEQLGTLLQE